MSAMSIEQIIQMQLDKFRLEMMTEIRRELVPELDPEFKEKIQQPGDINSHLRDTIYHLRRDVKCLREELSQTKELLHRAIKKIHLEVQEVQEAPVVEKKHDYDIDQERRNFGAIPNDDFIHKIHIRGILYYSNSSGLIWEIGDDDAICHFVGLLDTQTWTIDTSVPEPEYYDSDKDI